MMLAGTGSDVGKSVLAAALCRILRQDGYRPAPFKAQNMALNSYVTADGLEIGRAQAVQAEAAGISCEADMNPLLLKPHSNHSSQVVLLGRPIGNRDAYDYWRKPSSDSSSPKGGGGIDFRKEVCKAFDRLAKRFNPIVMEGAGSISELNLRDTDLVNMPMARYAQADVILVADIDRGGVFASVYGSIMLQTEEDRRRIKGIIVNKFRGDLRLFDNGRRMLEEICGVPVLGVIPYFKDIHIDEEDSVDLKDPPRPSLRGREKRPSPNLSLKGRGFLPPSQGGSGWVSIAVVRLPYISNFTDFNALEHDERIRLCYVTRAKELRKADIIILPGTKSTLADLRWLHQSGMAEAILHARREGKTIFGICGGYQMMGMEVLDPLHVEGDCERMSGLGLLPTTTTMTGEKCTRQVKFGMLAGEWRGSLGGECYLGGEWRVESGERNVLDLQNNTQGEKLSSLHSPLSTLHQDTTLHQNLTGYEIHMGETRPYGDGEIRPLVRFDDGDVDGCYVDEHCMGTYVHGILDNTPFVDMLLQPFADRVGERRESFDYAAFKEQQYDLLADHVRQHLDMDKLYEILTI